VTARQYWEQHFARFYRDPALAAAHRAELARMADGGPAALEIARRWASEHVVLADTADDLSQGARHAELARLLRSVIDAG
jgi:hypothetical protein